MKRAKKTQGKIYNPLEILSPMVLSPSLDVSSRAQWATRLIKIDWGDVGPVETFQENPHFTNCYRYFLPSEGKNNFSFFYKLSAINKFGSKKILSLGFLRTERF